MKCDIPGALVKATLWFVLNSLVAFLVEKRHYFSGYNCILG